MDVRERRGLKDQRLHRPGETRQRGRDDKEGEKKDGRHHPEVVVANDAGRVEDKHHDEADIARRHQRILKWVLAHISL